MDALVKPAFVDVAADRRVAAALIASGQPLAHAFGNIYALSMRPDAGSVARANLMKGRPAGQTGSALTTRRHMEALFDWDAVPRVFPRPALLSLFDELLDAGPIGLRGPAAASIPTHLAGEDGGRRTVQFVSPGSRCPSNIMVAAATEMLGTRYLCVTSANRSHHATGAAEEPAHFEALPLALDFAGTRLPILRHRDEAAVRAAHPRHAPISTSILAFHRYAGLGPEGCPALTLERHGSLDIVDLVPILARHGFALAIGAGASRRLGQRPLFSLGAAA
ncbi:hypothetical protein OSH08_00830 [Kaistia geumhonensis]|uniref:YrdC-like domain-containing protein n=1 Tax=Kaistia geumhonensis TaxID=410839 RepID=A0ABU0M8H7_9HYPH|nr:hypothetical protein [Kaistia geumhonensis]MCX5477527.1 hypothetical protein [Kaistia geumhonensis]MDQ0517266.1 hypothetical protein [Kaistia geumhonensis]